MVTCRSPMASSSAACVFAGARLISSASRRSVNTGPARNSEVRPPSRSTLIPVMSDGHEIRRELDSAEPRVERTRQHAHEQRLRGARHALEQRVAPREKGDQRLVDHTLLSDDSLRHHRAHARERVGDLLWCDHVMKFLSMWSIAAPAETSCSVEGLFASACVKRINLASRARACARAAARDRRRR